MSKMYKIEMIPEEFLLDLAKLINDGIPETKFTNARIEDDKFIVSMTYEGSTHDAISVPLTIFEEN